MRLCSDLAFALQFVAAVIKHIASAAILAVLPLVGACAQLDSEDADQDGTAIEFPAAEPEQIWVDGEQLVDGNVQGSAAAGACACTSAECFEAWVVDSFGCDVCVTFVCDGEAVAHSCAACNEHPLNNGEEWTGDGELE